MIALAVRLGGVSLGLDRPVVFALLPVAAIVLWLLVLRPSAASETGRRARLALFGSRFVIITCLLTAGAAPYTVTTVESAGEPRVTLLEDRSASMAVTPAVADDLAAAIEARGVPVDTGVVATGTDSRIGDGVIANLDRDGSVVVISDGQVTAGRSLAEAAEVANAVNATINAVEVTPASADRSVRLAGPGTTSAGVENAFLVSVDGVDLEGTERSISVAVDNETVLETTVAGTDNVEFSHRFDRVGTHRLVARVSGSDAVGANDVFYKTVRVVEPPRILYVARGDYPFEALLRDLYDVRRVDSIPSDLDPYDAVVVHDVAAQDLGDVEALQRYVINGGGLLVAGGANAFDRGGYAESAVAGLLPVRSGEAGGDRARVVLLVDVSGSTEGGMRVQKAVALDALDQLGDETEVGLVAFNHRAFGVADLRRLGGSRSELEDRIRRLESSGGTAISVGLRGAADLLGDRGGTVILLSDGWDDSPGPRAVASDLRGQGIRVVVVGVGERVNAPLLRDVAAEGGGMYLRADETTRLRILFGGSDRQFSGTGLTVVDAAHFITTGVEPTADPGRTNQVTAKAGAGFLVADRDGTPALTAWRFGLGRVVAVTAYGADGTLDGLLARPDSLLLSKSVNWVVGDPTRDRMGLVSLPDTRVGEPTTAVYRGAARPASDHGFVRTGPDTYRATVTPETAGFHPVLDGTFAASYPREFARLGPAPALDEAVAATGGETFDPADADAIATAVRRQQTRLRDVRREWDWAFLLVALVAFLGEIGARRLYGSRARTPP